MSNHIFMPASARITDACLAERRELVADQERMANATVTCDSWPVAFGAQHLVVVDGVSNTVEEQAAIANNLTAQGFKRVVLG
jgi:hypothetical protein